MGENQQGVVLVTEIPIILKTLARLVTRGFYTIEDSLIVDMLVRHNCMKEKDIEELLKIDSRLVRVRLATLKKDKIVQTCLSSETGPDGKTYRMTYFFINYTSLVNVTKYKLDHMRKRMEAQERDSINRISFKCTNCCKTFTEFEAGELFDHMTGAFCCTFCKQPVEEDVSNVPKDSGLLFAKFNEQLQRLYDILKIVEGIKIAPELLKPQPRKIFTDASSNERIGTWSEDVARMTGSSETKIDIIIGNEQANREEKKEMPIWMAESTIGDYGERTTASSRPNLTENPSMDREGSSAYPVFLEHDSDEDMDVNVEGTTSGGNFPSSSSFNPQQS